VEEQRRLLQVLEDRIKRAASGDLSIALAAYTPLEQEAMAAFDADRPDDANACYVLGMLHWYRAMALMKAGLDFHEDYASAVEMLGECFVAGFGCNRLPESLLPVLAEHDLPRAEQLLHAAIEGPRQERDLSTVVESWRRIASALPGGHRTRASALSNLGNALQLRFSAAGNQADIDEAIEAGHRAVAAAPAGDNRLPMLLTNLASALQVRFSVTGNQADIDEAIELGHRAVAAAPAGDPSLQAIRDNLYLALGLRGDHTGNLADIDQAVDLARKRIALTPDDHPGLPARLGDLADALSMRATRTGAMPDLDEAIACARNATSVMSLGDPGLVRTLNSLSNGLRSRGTRTGALADLDEAIQAARRAMETISRRGPDLAATLTNLTAALHARHDRTHKGADLDEAIETIRQAAFEAPRDHPLTSVILVNLSQALRKRARPSGREADLDDAVGTARQAVSAARGTRDRIHSLTELGSALQLRGYRSGNQPDLDEAVLVYFDVLTIIPDDDPGRARPLRELGNVFLSRAVQSGDDKDRDQAASMFIAAASTVGARPSLRIVASAGAAVAIMLRDQETALRLWEDAVRLLSEAAPRSLTREDQQREITTYGNLAARAAAQAMAEFGPVADRHARVLGLLEAGRAVLLRQALEARDDLTALRERHPALAARLEELRDLLDQPADYPSPLAAPGPGVAAESSRSAGLRTDDRRQAAGELAGLLARIRSLPGFARFGLAPDREELLAEAGEGPIVTLNVSDLGSDFRSHAFLLTAVGVRVVELADLDAAILADRVSSFHRALAITASPHASGPARQTAETEICRVLEWLWDAVAEPVLTALGYRESAHAGQWPRVWWVPTGQLTQMPLHAAGHHSDPDGPRRRTVMDRVISSHTPVISALRYSRRRLAQAEDHVDRSLIVGLPATPGSSHLPGVRTEISLIRSRLPHPLILGEAGDNAEEPVLAPTLANVERYLPGCSLAHFACHARSNASDPSQSYLLLHDHAEHPFTLARIAAANLGRARLAYLSACETAFTADLALLDEAVQLVSAFQLAGFPHVVGTLWPVNDRVAVEVADAFYEALSAPDGAVDTGRAAIALHHATRAMRTRYPRSPSLWAAYLYAGA
jgi:hypothetical protein